MIIEILIKLSPITVPKSRSELNLLLVDILLKTVNFLKIKTNKIIKFTKVK